MQQRLFLAEMLAVITVLYTTLVVITATNSTTQQYSKGLPFFWSVITGTDEVAENVAGILKELTSAMNRRITQLEVEMKELKEENKRLQNTISREHVKQRWTSVGSGMECNDTDVEDRLQQLELLVKNKTARTCHQLKKNGVKTSGFHFIDPDGVGVSEGPLKVFCDMETGATEIYHDSMESMTVTKCESAGCYERKIDYGVPLSQIEALIGLSTSCSQTIRFDCMMAALNREDTPFGWWEDRSGSVKFYWHGNNSVGLTATCKCGHENSCQFQSYMCNCDGLFPTRTYDEGELTNKTSLPVTSLHYGGIIYDLQEANHTLGPLKCLGEAPTPLGVSCESLRIDGATVSGYYTVSPNGGDKLELVFCDMTRSPTDVNFQRKISEIHTGKPTGVAFDVSHSQTDQVSGILSFLIVRLNQGNAMQIKTGKFTAPQSGVYVFIVSIAAGHQYRHRQSTLAALYINEEQATILKPNVDTELPAHQPLIRYLEEGDVVYVKKRSGYISEVNSQFSGFLLY